MSQIYLIFVTDSQSKSTLRTQSHEFGYNCAMKIVYKDSCSAATVKGNDERGHGKEFGDSPGLISTKERLPLKNSASDAPIEPMVKI